MSETHPPFRPSVAVKPSANPPYVSLQLPDRIDHFAFELPLLRNPGKVDHPLQVHLRADLIEASPTARMLPERRQERHGARWGERLAKCQRRPSHFSLSGLYVLRATDCVG